MIVLMKLALAIGIMLIVVCMCSTKENMFGFSGYKQPVDITIKTGIPSLDGYSPVDSSVSADEVNHCIEAATSFFSRKSGVCVYPIETNAFEKFYNLETKDIIYKFRIMFSTTSSGFPYGIGCTFYVKDGKVVGATTQQLGGKSAFVPFNEDIGYEFLTVSEIVSEQEKSILGN
tara:strand:+ start:294 stop:815 length:522 start_codon:yes stop_codon:yes gene_type:complete